MGAGGNHLAVVSASGKQLGKKEPRLIERDLHSALEEYARLPKQERLAELEDPALAKPPARPVPQPPVNGLIIRGYCTYVKLNESKSVVRSPQFYYEENPDRWQAETQSDLLWLSEAEWNSLIPPQPKVGDRSEVRPAIQKRFYSTIGIDYMEGSVNSLPATAHTMTLTVRKVDDHQLVLQLDGEAQLGVEFAEQGRLKPNSRGCNLRVLGEVQYNRSQKKIERFDVVGIGRAWGNKMDYLDREVRLKDYPWMYGIAWELVTGTAPQDRIPPYNLLHYNSAGPYFEPTK